MCGDHLQVNLRQSIEGGQNKRNFLSMMSLTPIIFPSIGSFFDPDPATASTVTTPPAPGTKPATDCSSDSVDLVTSPSTSSFNNSPIKSSATVLNSESIEVLGAIAEPRSENSSFMVVASSASSTPASEFSEANDAVDEVQCNGPRAISNAISGLDGDEEEEEENTMSESLAVTVMEPKDIKDSTASARQNLHLSLSPNLNKTPLTAATSGDMDASSSSDQTLINHRRAGDTSPGVMDHSDNERQQKSILSLENYELQTEFSDSTHSFEEVSRSTGNREQPPTNTSSGDELETTTSSDIEIISNPNGCDSSTHSRLSPNKENSHSVGGLLRSNRGHSR